MAMTYYVDVPTNTDLELDNHKAIAEVVSSAAKILATTTLTFSVETGGAYRISGTGIGTMFAAGDRIIVRDSIDAEGVDNDGCYTVKVGGTAGWIEVEEPVKESAVSAVAAFVEEYDTFILHPTKRSEQICVSVLLGAITHVEVSFEPGGFWAAPTKPGLPLMQGKPLTGTQNYVQVETGKFLQDKLGDLPVDATPTNDVEKKGTMLMRVFPVKGTALGALVNVGLIQLH